MERKPVLGKLIAALLVTTACMTSPSRPGAHLSSVAGSTQDSVVVLRTRAPSDSIVVERGEFSILLSIAEVETASTNACPGSDRAALRDALRREYQELGWARLGDGEAEDFLVADLIKQGRAAIRSRTRGQLLPWITLSLERQSIGSGNTIVGYEVFSAPDKTVIMRVMSEVVIS